MSVSIQILNTSQQSQIQRDEKLLCNATSYANTKQKLVSEHTCYPQMGTSVCCEMEADFHDGHDHGSRDHPLPLYRD